MIFKMQNRRLRIISSFISSKQKKTLLLNCLRAFFSGGISGVKDYLSSRYLSKQVVGGFGIDCITRDLFLSSRSVYIWASKDDLELAYSLRKLFATISITAHIVSDVKLLIDKIPSVIINPMNELDCRNSIAYFPQKVPTFNLANYRYFWLEDSSLVPMLQEQHTIKFQQIYLLHSNQPYQADSVINNPDYYFYRFALGIGIISYSQFWDLTHEMISLSNNRLCLSLPEQQIRRQDFMSDALQYNFMLFDGLRHELGWVGCGLSYKYLLNLAAKYNLKNILICEDDVEFYNGFSTQVQSIERFLSNSSYSIFSGLIADLSPSAKVKQIHTFEGIDFIELDKMTSTVFNFYHFSIYNHVISWDETNLDRDINAIDRYIEGLPNLSIITTLPFLVGHKEEHSSTVWGLQNTHYHNIIKKSKARLQALVAKYHKDRQINE